MSIKLVFLFLASYLFSIGCKTPSPKDPYSKYSTTQKDSIAAQFKEFSEYMAQPTHAYRSLLDSAIMLSPQNAEYHQVLSYSYKKRGDHILAMRHLNEAVVLDLQKPSTSALEYRAWSLLYFYRDYEATIADVDLITKMKKTNYNVCWGEPCGLLKGQALMRLSRYVEALSVLDTVLVEEVRKGFKAEDNFLVHYYKGRCFHLLHQYENALASYQQVLALDANFTEALYQVGLIYIAQDKKELAKSYLDKALFWIKKKKKMGEPYFERFDEVFEWQISAALKLL